MLPDIAIWIGWLSTCIPPRWWRASPRPKMLDVSCCRLHAFNCKFYQNEKWFGKGIMVSVHLINSGLFSYTKLPLGMSTLQDYYMMSERLSNFQILNQVSFFILFCQLSIIFFWPFVNLLGGMLYSNLLTPMTIPITSWWCYK